MPNYDYANSAGLTALSERTFEKIKKEITTDVVTSEAENPLVIETAAAQKAKSTIVKVEPIQDLHGYGHPWPAGGGKNLFDEQYPNIDGSMRRIYVQTGDGTFTLSTTALIVGGGAANLFLQAGQATSGESTTNNGVYSGMPRTVTAIDGYVTISYRIVNDTTDAGNPLNCKTQLEVGSTATSYEPYSNICPISGLDEVEIERTGFNQWDEEWEAGDINATTGEDQSGSTIRSINYIPVVSGEVYYIPNPDVARVCAYDAKKNFVSTLEFPSGRCEIPNNVSFIRFRTQIAYGTVYNNDLCINIFDPNKNGTYEPYQKFSAEVPLPATIYGGTLNLETGEVVVDKVLWSANTSSMNNSENYPGWANCGIANIVGYGLNYTLRNMVGNIGTSVSVNTTNTGATGTVFLVTEDYEKTQTEWKSLAVDVQFIFPLITPKTYHLTPAQLDLLKGTNVITVNGKTIQVTYREGSLATLEELNAISSDLSNVKSKLPPIIIKDGMLQVTYDDGQ